MDKKFYGKLPVHLSGSNKGQLDRRAVAKLFGFTYLEIVKAYNCWLNIFRYKESTLTFEQYLKKMRQAGISPNSLGITVDSWCLARINDEGPYTNKSCRFLTRAENLAEQKHPSRWNNLAPSSNG